MTDPAPPPIAEQPRTVPPEARPTPKRRLGVLMVGALGLILALSGSWVAGYLLSQRAASTSPPSFMEDPPAQEAEPGTDQKDEDRSSKRDNDKKGSQGKRSGDSDDQTSVPAGSAQVSSGSSGPASETTKTSGTTGSGTKGTSNEPAPPQPDVRLYHLFHAEGDHYMTVSSAAANEKQAAGYTAAVEGRAFSKQVKGTVAIALDDGVAYIYRNREAVPRGVSATDLYKLTRDGDFFYTSSSSVANQAEAQGWSRSLAGVIAT